MRDGVESLYDPVRVGSTVPSVTEITSIGPIPASRFVNVGVSLAHKERVRVRVFDTQGRHLRTLFDQDADSGPRVITSVLDRGLSSGLYLLVVEAGNRRDVQKIIVSR